MQAKITIKIEVAGEWVDIEVPEEYIVSVPGGLFITGKSVRGLKSLAKQRGIDCDSCTTTPSPKYVDANINAFSELKL